MKALAVVDSTMDASPKKKNEHIVNPTTLKPLPAKQAWL